MNIELATTIFLIAVFTSAELYRLLRGKTGVVVGFIEGFPGTAMLANKVQVELVTGELVTAEMNACVACLGRVGIGTEVRVTESRDGFVVHLPWFRSGKCCGATRHPISRSVANN
jgi:hypothetical protein